MVNSEHLVIVSDTHDRKEAVVETAEVVVIEIITLAPNWDCKSPFKSFSFLLGSKSYDFMSESP